MSRVSSAARASCPGDLDQSSSRLLARLRWLWLLGRLGRRPLSSVRLRRHAERANRIADCGRGRYGRSGRHRWVAGELRPEPAARVTQSAPLARARAQPEAVQRSDCGVHVRGYSPSGLNVYQRHGTVGFDARATQNGHSYLRWLCLKLGPGLLFGLALPHLIRLFGLDAHDAFGCFLPCWGRLPCASPVETPLADPGETRIRSVTANGLPTLGVTVPGMDEVGGPSLPRSSVPVTCSTPRPFVVSSDANEIPVLQRCVHRARGHPRWATIGVQFDHCHFGELVEIDRQESSEQIRS